MSDVGARELICYILFGTGIAFNFFGCLGLVRLPDVYNRLQAATKCVTLGTCLILVGVAIAAGLAAKPLAIKALVCAFFIALTAPVGAHALARGAYRSGVELCEGSVVDEYADSPAMDRFRAEAAAKEPEEQSIRLQEHADAKA